MSMSSDQLIAARMYLADPGTDAVQSIQIDNATGGTFAITWSGQTTAAIAWNAGSNDVQNKFCALSNVGVGNAQVVLNAGVPGTVFFVIYFTGDLAGAAQAMVTVTSSLTGTGVLVTVQQVTAGGITAFSDDELNTLYSDASQNFFLAICFGFRVLQANAAKFADYVAGQTEEKKSQIFRQLSEMEQLYQDWSQAGQQVQIARFTQVPPRLRAEPTTNGVPATSLSCAPPFSRRRWGGW